MILIACVFVFCFVFRIKSLRVELVPVEGVLSVMIKVVATA